MSTDLSNLFSRFPRSKRKAELEYPSKMAAIKEEREVEDYKRKGRRSSQVRGLPFFSYNKVALWGRDLKTEKVEPNWFCLSINSEQLLPFSSLW